MPALILAETTPSTPETVATQSNSAQKTPEKGLRIKLAIDPTATVADLMCVKKDDSYGFIIPTTPEFTSRFPWQISPWKLKNYKTSYATDWGNEQRIPTASLVRFIKQSDVLFEDFPETRKSYQLALQKAITAHKKWFSNQTQENFIDLRAKEAEVEQLLKTLSFSNPFVEAHLKKILSSPDDSYFTSFLNFLSLPQQVIAAKITKTTGQVTEKFVPRKFGILWPAAWVLIKNTLIAAALSGLVDPGMAKLVCLMALVKILYDWKTDNNFTPEPAGGVNFDLSVNYGSYSQDYPDSPF